MPATLLTERPQALRDREHRLVRELVEKGVRHPVGGAVVAQDDHVQVGAGVVEVELAALDPVLEVRLLEDRRVRPVRLLDPPVVAEGVRAVDDADGLVALRDRVGADGLERGGRRRLLEQERILEPERHLPPDGADERNRPFPFSTTSEILDGLSACERNFVPSARAVAFPAASTSGFENCCTACATAPGGAASSALNGPACWRFSSFGWKKCPLGSPYRKRAYETIVPSETGWFPDWPTSTFEVIACTSFGTLVIENDALTCSLNAFTNACWRATR